MKRLISTPVAVTILLLLSTLAIGALTARRIPEPLAMPLSQISPEIAGWSEFDNQSLTPGTLRELRADAYLCRSYRNAASQLNLFVAFYAEQRAGESMHSPKHCLPGAGWEILESKLIPVPVNKRAVQINRDVITNLGNRMLMLYWYQSRNRVIASEYLGKILLARDAALTGRTAGSIVRILVPDTPELERQSIAFASGVIPEVQRCFGGTPN